MDLPFEPQPLETLKQRVPQAFERVWNPVANKDKESGDRPIERREHVFDFEDGVRMVVSVDFSELRDVFTNKLLSVDKRLHVSGRSMKDGRLIISTRAMMKHMQDIGITPTMPECNLVSADDNHAMYRDMWFVYVEDHEQAFAE